MNLVCGNTKSKVLPSEAPQGRVREGVKSVVLYEALPLPAPPCLAEKVTATAAAGGLAGGLLLSSE